MVIAVIMLVAVVSLGKLVYENMWTLRVWKTSQEFTTEEISDKLNKNAEETQKLLDSITKSELSELSDEERKEYSAGNMTRDDIKNIILGYDAESVDPKITSKKDDIIADIYILRAEYLNEIDRLLEEAKSDIRQIPKDKRTVSKMMGFVKKYTEKGTLLESECDKKMEGLLVKLEGELKRNKENLTIVADIRNYYKQEKELKKSELLKIYMPHISTN